LGEGRVAVWSVGEWMEADVDDAFVGDLVEAVEDVWV
jgi:hypothetical protein